MSALEEKCDAGEWLEQQGFDLAALATPAPAPAKPAEFVPDLGSYSRFVVFFSAGKDSLALVLRLLELGVPAEMIELHQHCVDGREGSQLFDWPCTHGYAEAVAKALGVEIGFSWRKGGFERELLRREQPTAPMMVPNASGGYSEVGGRGPLGTRRRFPQLSADLSVRWCSGSLKIGVADAYLRHHPKFLASRTLVLTGERAEESRARATYKQFEPHRSDTRTSKKVPRHIDVWRAVHQWSEREVWAIIERWRMLPHPAYLLGWGRTSCRPCIYGSKNQWASVRAIAPEQFEHIAKYEREFEVKIHRKETVVERADKGTPYEMDPKWVAVANSREFNVPVFMDPWVLPKGAFGESCGPT